MGINSLADKNIRIGIVDTGISSANYSMISRSIIGGHNFSLDGTGRHYIKAETYHGFAVASIILKVTPKAKLVIAKVLNDKGEGNPKKTAEGIRYCISKKCHIINCSIAGPHDPELEDAVNEACSKGIVIVGATGNDGRNRLLYPASYTNCIGVGACDKYNKLAKFSNYNIFMDLIAFGDEVKITTKEGIIIDRGTSFSAPLVTGELALLRQRFELRYNRPPKCDELKNMLLKKCIFNPSVDPIEQGNGYLG